ncbi:MAG TPA: hypothetical protein VI078_01680 [bacterium]
MRLKARPGEGARALVVALALGAATLAVYSRVLGHEFLADYDDCYYVTENATVLGGLTPAAVRWAFTTTDAAFWHPLTWLSHMTDVTLFGLNPAGHHVTAVLLHAAAALALFIALRAATGALWRSALVAALFAMHPLHVESVAWVSERKDVLCALFWFLGIAAWVAYVRRPGPLRYAAAFGAYTAALMSKSMAVTFVFVLLLLDFWPLGRLGPAGGAASREKWRRSRRRVLLEKVPFLLLVPVAAALSYRAQIAFGSVTREAAYALGYRVANALLSYAEYLVQALYPRDLAAYYPHPGAGVRVGAAVACGALLLLAAALCVWRARARPYLAAGWFWYLGTLVPVIGIVQVGEFARADRYTYVPLVGVFVAVVWGVADLGAHLRVRAVHRAGVAVAVLTAFATLTWAQSGYWRDEVTLWTRTLAVTRENGHAHMQLGLAWLRRGEAERAAGEFREVLRILPGFDWAMQFLAEALEMAGDRDEAALWRERARQAGAAPGGAGARFPAR